MIIISVVKFGVYCDYANEMCIREVFT